MTDEAPPANRLQVRHGVRVGLRATVAAVSLVAIVGSGIAWATYQKFKASVPHGDPVPALAAGKTDPDGKDQNILLLGNDSRAGASPAELSALSTTDDGGSVNTDTMMVLHVPANGSRDGYSASKGKGGTEVQNESAGIRLLIRTITGLTGLHIDHYVQVNLLGFYRISNAIGGVTVCLNQAQNPSTDKDQFGSGYSGINLPAGISVIKGSQALAFVRQRHGLPNGDLDRIKRQQYFLSAAFRKVTSGGVLLNPFKLRNLMNAVSSSLLTDPDLDVLSLAREFENMSSGNITYATIPNEGPQTIYPDGVMTSIVQVDTAAIPGFVNTLRGLPADPGLSTAKPAAPSSVTLDVLNGTSTAGLAGRNADALKKVGFHVNKVDSTDPATSTTVEYPAGQQGGAKAVAAAVPGAQLVQTNSVQRVTLVLGDNDVQAKALMPAGAQSGTHDAIGEFGQRAAAPTPPPAGAAPAPSCIN